MRLLKTVRRNTGKPRLKASASPVAMLARCAAPVAAIAAAYALGLWIVVPYVVFAMTMFKLEPASAPEALDAYVENHLLDGWSIVSQMPSYETPAFMLATLLTVGALLLLLRFAGEIASGAFTPPVLKNIFGPAASPGNEKGSARLFADELELALLTETWSGDWSDPPAYSAPIVGYSHTFGYYLAPKELHTIAFGISGAGKTTTLNYCSLDALAASGASVVITDPKGEIYNNTAAGLRAHGVNVRVVDFRNVARSHCINPVKPLTRVFMQYMDEYREHLSKALDIAKREGVSPEQAPAAQAWPSKEAYEEYFSEIRLADFARSNARSKSENYALDLAGALIPPRVDAGPAEHWEECARQLLTSLLLLVGTYVKEDFVAEDERPYTEPLPEQRTLASVQHLLSEYGEGDEKSRELAKVLGKIDGHHPARKRFAQAKAAGAQEYKTYVSETIKFLSSVLSDDVNAILNGSDVDLVRLGEEQTILYVVLPDEKPMMGKLFTTMVAQAYQELIGCALRSGGSLPVPVHFMLEELGNLPVPVPDLPGKMSMGRGYGISFHITLQDMEQLPVRYEKSGQSTILSNCGARMLLKTNDAQGTARYFSDNMGRYTYVSRRVTHSRKSLGLLDDSSSSSTSESERPVMYPEELCNWDPEWGTITLLSKPGKRPGKLVRLLYGYRTMQPCVFPREYAWNTETARNLGITNDPDERARKTKLAEAESRIAERTPNVVWEPRALSSSERMELDRLLVPGGVTPRAIEGFRSFSASMDAKPYVLAYLSTQVTPKMLFDGGPDAIDNIAASLKDAYKEELRESDGSVDKKAPGYDPEALVRARKVKLAAADALVFELLSAALRDGDATLLATELSQDDFKPSSEISPPIEAPPKPVKPKRHRPGPAKSRDKGWIDEIRTALKAPYEQAGTLEEFLALAKGAGVEFLEAGSGYSCRLKGRKNAISASKVGSKYTREALEKRYAATADRPKE